MSHRSGSPAAVIEHRVSRGGRDQGLNHESPGVEAAPTDKREDCECVLACLSRNGFVIRLAASVCVCVWTPGLCVHIKKVLQNSSHSPAVCDIVCFIIILLLNQEKSIIPRADKGNINVSIVPPRMGGRILHMIDFQTLLICGGDFSMVECAIDALLLPAYNGTMPER